MANKWVTHDFSNYPPGGPLSSAYLADADEFNQNYQDVCDAVGARYIRGVSCADKNSTTTTCEIWLEADGGQRDVCDADWIALVYYSTDHVWETTVSVSGSDCYIVFGDSQLENPATSGVSDYSAAAFIDALHIVLFPKKIMLPKDWVITTSGAGGGLTTQEIYHGSETLSAFIADVKTRLDTICKAGGGLNDDVVDSSAIDGAEAVRLDGPINLLAGGSLEHYGDQHNLLFRVEMYNGVSEDYSILDAETPPTNTDGSKHAQKVEASGSNIGILLPTNPQFEGAILAGKQVSATFRVKSDTANSLDVGFLVDSTACFDTPTIAAEAWETVTVTKTISSNATVVKALVRSNQECEFVVARAQMNLGEKAYGFSIGPYEDAAQILMDTTQDNLLYNGGFERWTQPTDNTKPPDGWFAVEGPTFNDPAGDTNPAGTGNKLCETTLDANDGMGQYLGLVTAGYDGTCVNENILVGLVRGSKVCASIDMMFDATSTGKIRLILGDIVDATTSAETTLDVEPLNEEMRRFAVYHTVTTGAKQVYFKILNNEAGAKGISVDNAMLHVGEFPLKFKPSAGWREMRWDFSDETAEAGFNMDAAGISSGEYHMPGEAGAYLMLKAAARVLTAPNDDTTYRLYVDDTTADGISLTIGNGEYYKANHVTNYSGTAAVKHECTQYIKAPECSETGATPAGGVIFSVWGYCYAS